MGREALAEHLTNRKKNLRRAALHAAQPTSRKKNLRHAALHAAQPTSRKRNLRRAALHAAQAINRKSILNNGQRDSYTMTGPPAVRALEDSF